MKTFILKIIFGILVVGGVALAAYDSFLLDDRVKENMRIADSLRAEVNKYHQRYDSLLVVAGKLDQKIEDEERRIDSLKKRPPVIREPKPPIVTADSAVNFLEDFIKD